MGAACGTGGGGKDMAWLLDAAVKIFTYEEATYSMTAGRSNSMHYHYSIWQMLLHALPKPAVVCSIPAEAYCGPLLAGLGGGPGKDAAYRQHRGPCQAAQDSSKVLCAV